MRAFGYLLGGIAEISVSLLAQMLTELVSKQTDPGFFGFIDLLRRNDREILKRENNIVLSYLSQNLVIFCKLYSISLKLIECKVHIYFQFCNRIVEDRERRINMTNSRDLQELSSD